MITTVGIHLDDEEIGKIRKTEYVDFSMLSIGDVDIFVSSLQQAEHLEIVVTAIANSWRKREGKAELRLVREDQR